MRRYLIIALVLAASAWIGHALAPEHHDLSVYAAPSAALHEGVEVCTDHNPNMWHPLVKRDAGGAITCTYKHEHHDDPNSPEMVAIFGQAGAWYGSANTISYPWQTHGAAGPENTAKHEGYKWFTAKDIVYTPQAGRVKSFRIQVHARGDASDQVTRFHSFLMETQVEQNGKVGIVRHGGHIDTGFLALITNGGNGAACPPLPDNPAGFRCRLSGTHRDSGSIQPLPAGHTAHGNPSPTWYTGHGVTSLSFSFETFGPMEYTNPATQHFFPAADKRNNSSGRTGLNVFISPQLAALKGPDGLLNVTKYTDRNGVVIADCSPVGADCIPLKFEGVYPANYIAQGGFLPMREFDVMSPVNGKSLIAFPN